MNSILLWRTRIIIWSIVHNTWNISAQILDCRFVFWYVYLAKEIKILYSERNCVDMWIYMGLIIAELNGRQRGRTVYHWCYECIENDVNEYWDALLGSYVMQIFRHSYANAAGDQKQFRNIRQNLDRSTVRYSHIWRTWDFAIKPTNIEYIFLLYLLSLLDFRKSTICFGRTKLLEERPSEKYI